MSWTNRTFTVTAKIAALADDGVTDLLFATGPANYPHIEVFQLEVGRGDIDVLFYEDTTTSDDGTPLGASNLNRNSAITADMVVSTAPTVTGVGTLLTTRWVAPTATGVGQSGGGGGGSSVAHYVLKPSSKYLVRITNKSGATIDLAAVLVFSETGLGE